MSNEKPGGGYRIGYARVSTLEQDEALQRDALTAAGCQRIFVDKVSGKLEHRPALDAMPEQLRPGDSVTVWRLDRLGRSLRHLIDTVADLEARGVAFRSLTESIDTSTPGGKLTFHLFGALAEFERDLIRERTMAGLAAARARGRTAIVSPSTSVKVKSVLAKAEVDFAGGSITLLNARNDQAACQGATITLDYLLK